MRKTLDTASNCTLTQSLCIRLPDPMDAAQAFRLPAWGAGTLKRRDLGARTLCSRLPDPMDAVRAFRSGQRKPKKGAEQPTPIQHIERNSIRA
jgi:hypothetical protein